MTKAYDTQIVQHYVDTKSESAFLSLTERYGGMVHHVCFSVLRNDADADDATQATFLVLANKAHTLKTHSSLGAFLHRVALCAARDLLKANQRRTRREQEARPMIHPDNPHRLQPEQENLLHASINDLPEKYRLPVLLHHIDGFSYADAAKQLGCKEKTFSSRLSRGRDMLRSKLAKRGLTLSTAILIGCFQNMAQAASPAILNTIPTTIAVPHVVSLAQGIHTASSLGNTWFTGQAALLASTALLSGSIAIYSLAEKSTVVDIPQVDLPQKTIATDKTPTPFHGIPKGFHEIARVALPPTYSSASLDNFSVSWSDDSQSIFFSIPQFLNQSGEPSTQIQLYSYTLGEQSLRKHAETQPSTISSLSYRIQSHHQLKDGSFLIWVEDAISHWNHGKTIHLTDTLGKSQTIVLSPTESSLALIVTTPATDQQTWLLHNMYGKNTVALSDLQTGHAHSITLQHELREGHHPHYSIGQWHTDYELDIAVQLIPTTNKKATRQMFKDYSQIQPTWIRYNTATQTCENLPSAPVQTSTTRQQFLRTALNFGARENILAPYRSTSLSEEHVLSRIIEKRESPIPHAVALVIHDASGQEIQRIDRSAITQSATSDFYIRASSLSGRYIVLSEITDLHEKQVPHKKESFFTQYTCGAHLLFDLETESVVTELSLPEKLSITGNDHHNHVIRIMEQQQLVTIASRVSNEKYYNSTQLTAITFTGQSTNLLPQLQLTEQQTVQCNSLRPSPVNSHKEFFTLTSGTKRKYRQGPPYDLFMFCRSDQAIWVHHAEDQDSQAYYPQLSPNHQYLLFIEGQEIVINQLADVQGDALKLPDPIATEAIGF